MHKSRKRSAAAVAPPGMARLVRIGVKIARCRMRPLLLRHGRAWPGHPRLVVLIAAKSWMAGTRPAMTGREKTLLQPSPYPDSHGNTPGHDDGAGTCAA